MTEETYNAELAGLHHSIENGTYGVGVRVWGYDEKQRLFIKHLTERLATFEPDAGRFEVLKENFVRSIKNFKQDQPYAQAVFYTTLLLSERLWSKEQLLKVADGKILFFLKSRNSSLSIFRIAHSILTNILIFLGVTLESLKKFIPELLSAVHIEALVHGNVTKEVSLHQAFVFLSVRY